jgi:uracil-DNA glycosylase
MSLLTAEEKQALINRTNEQRINFPLMILEPLPSTSFNLAWKTTPPPDWLQFLLSYEAELMVLENGITRSSGGSKVYPEPQEIFRALYRCTNPRVLILGQDPYPGKDSRGLPYAHGLAFSTPSNRSPLPESLKNIFKEIERDLSSSSPGKIINKNPDLTRWSMQGVLLLNASLTVLEGTPNSHNLNWKNFMETLLKEIGRRHPKLICLFWGSEAKKWKKTLPKEYVLESSHPSPLGVYRGFEGCGHFSKVNEILVARGETPIEW